MTSTLTSGLPSPPKKKTSTTTNTNKHRIMQPTYSRTTAVARSTIVVEYIHLLHPVLLVSQHSGLHPGILNKQQQQQ